MTNIETEAKTVEDAVKAACEQLGIERENASVEVLREPRSILGVQTKSARVRVSAAEENNSAKAETDADREHLKFQKGRDADESLSPPDDDSAKELDDDRDNFVEERPVRDPNFDPEQALRRICEAIEPECEVSSKQEDDRLLLSVSSSGSGIFIGRRGETLDSLQYIINRMASKQNPHIGRIVVDSENYRSRKIARLKDDAKIMAAKVRRYGKPTTTEPLSAFDRRVIHTTLVDEEGIDTRSLGRGDRKRVQIFSTARREAGRDSRS